jgi:hypothetical protein
MPVYPWLLSATAPGHSDADDLFDAGQRLNIAITFVGLAALGAWARRWLGNLGAAAFVVAAASGVFVFRAPYVQAEPLFYLLFFAATVFMARALRNPGPLIGAAAGLTAAMAYLTKSSALPLIAIFVVALAIATIRSLCQGTGYRAWVATSAAFVAVVGATVAPYAVNSWRAYGNPAYNTNTSLYAWTDSWDESAALPLISGAYVGDPTERPSASRYLADHDLGAIRRRLAHGAWTIVEATVVRSLFGPLLLLQVGLAAFMATARRRTVRRWVRSEPMLVFFGMSILACYLVSIAWWAPQASGQRFVMTLYLPASAVCAAVIKRLGATIEVPWMRTDGATAAFSVILASATCCLILAAAVFAGSWPGGN